MKHPFSYSDLLSSYDIMREEKDVGIMKVLCFGSMNIDESYLMDHFVRPGETQSALKCTRSLGGKGFNQALAIAKAGGEVIMAGCIGRDGYDFKKALEQYHCTTQFIREVNAPTGHAFIQVAGGENAIVINHGANHAITDAFIDEVLSVMHAGDMILLQNEINNVDKIIKKAHERKLKIIFNAAPMHEAVLDYPLDVIDLLVVNVREAQALTNNPTSLEELMNALETKFMHQDILLTVGEQGSYYLSEGKRKYVAALSCHVVDTTGAGDTYIGYYLASLMANKSIEEAMQIASLAAACTCEKSGASSAIPTKDELKKAYIIRQAINLPVFEGKSVTYHKGEFDKNIPHFDEATKDYVYRFYKLGLFDEDYYKHFKKMGVKAIEDMDLLECVTMLTFYMREERVHTALMAHAIENGKFKAIADRLQELIRLEVAHD